MYKYLLSILFIELAWGQPFNYLNEIPLNSDDLIGQWTIGESELNMHLISGVDQTISDYGQSFGYTPSQGGIFISGAINGQMHYANLGTVGWSQNYYGIAMLQISNNPVSYGASNEDLEYPHYHFTYQYDGDSLECTLNLKTIVEGDTISRVWFSNSAYDSAVLIDTISNVVIIDSLMLLNTDSINSVLLSGQLAVNQIDIIAGESFTILSPFDVPQDYQNVFWDFFEDGSGIRVFEEVGHHNYFWSDSVQFNWTSIGDSVFVVDSSSFMQSFLYNILDGNLFLSNTMNGCGELEQNECIQYLDAMYSYLGIEDLQQVFLEVISVYTKTNPLSVIDNDILPNNIVLQQNYPNPFNPITTVRYELPEDSFVDVTVYDMLGNVVNNLVSANQSSGYKSIQWDATNNQGEPVSAGVYLYKIQAGNFVDTKKMILLK